MGVVGSAIMHSRKLYYSLVAKLRYYIKFSKAVCCIAGLILAYGLVENSLIAVLITHLTEVLSLKLANAAIIVNLQDGLSSILVIFAFHLSDTYFGLFNMILLTTVIYIFGLGLLFKVEYVALFFLAFGVTGKRVLYAFLCHQITPSYPVAVDDIEKAEIRQEVWWNSLWSISSILATFAVAALSWRNLTIISLSTMLAGLFCFFLGNSFYQKNEPTGGPFTTIFRVLKAAILRRHLKCPTNVVQPTIPFFRCLDKAAILQSSSISNEELQTNCKVCEVAEVREVKFFLNMIPMWTTFLVYSLVGAAGDTFFLEQPSFMDDHLGQIKHVPPTVFVIFQRSSSFIVSYICGKFFPKFRFLKTRQRLAILIQIGLGMMCCSFCCIASWRIEKFRRQKASHNSNVSVFWLTPQFVLLGFMEGFAGNGLDKFFQTQVSGSMRKYGPSFDESILGIGKFLCAILVVITKDWFGEDVDSSHLDRYYKLLALLGSLNFFFFVYIAVRYGNQHVETENVDESNLEDGFTDQFVSLLLPDKSYPFSFNIRQRSLQYPGRLIQRSLTAKF